MFDWKNSTPEECAQHILNTSAQNTTSVLTYHIGKGNDDIVEKIKSARLLAKKYRLLIRADKIRQELNKG